MLSSQTSFEENKRILAFKEKYKERGIFFDYSSVEDLKKAFYAHLSRHFILQNEKDKRNEMLTPKLSIQSLSNNELQRNFLVHDFGSSVFLNNPTDEVHNLFKRILAYRVYNYENSKTLGITIASRLNELYSTFSPKIIIDKEMQELIEMCAESLNIDLNENFFSLGNLRGDVLSSNQIFGGTSLIGSNDEKSKYKDLHNLYDAIEYCLGILNFKKLYEDLKYVKLAIINDGTTFDEDIEVTLSFKNDMLIKHRDLPIIDSYTLSKINKRHGLEDFFEIVKTSKFIDYNSTTKPVPVANTYRPIPSAYSLLSSNSDPIEDFYDVMDDIFIYDYFEEDGGTILKFHVDYLKHNTTAAFPTVLFVRHGNSDIDYILKSKYYKDEIKGKITRT